MPALCRFNCTLLFALPVLALACSGGEEKQAVQAPVAPVTKEAAPVAKTEKAEEDFSKVTARLKVIGLDGLPILGMAPIATKQPNAFDAPVATGPLSNKDGLTEFEFPGDQKLYIRAWDPDGRMFANNFFDAVPNTGNVSDELMIQMAPGSFITATVLDADNLPRADASIDAMLSHPTAGPWWPVTGKTDAAGKLRLGPVPPGQFTISLKDEGNHKLELPATFLPPTETVELGTLVLQ